MPSDINIAKIKLNQNQIDFLADINPFNLEGRYPEYEIPPLSSNEAEEYLTQCTEFILWLTRQL